MTRDEKRELSVARRNVTSLGQQVDHLVAHAGHLGDALEAEKREVKRLQDELVEARADRGRVSDVFADAMVVFALKALAASSCGWLSAHLESLAEDFEHGRLEVKEVAS